MAVAGGIKYSSDETDAALELLSNHKSKSTAPTESTRMSQMKARINVRLH